MTSLAATYQVIRKPGRHREGDRRLSTSRNAYHFRVPRDANKVEIRQAVEKLFEVKVLARQHPERQGQVAAAAAASSGTTPELEEGHGHARTRARRSTIL